MICGAELKAQVLLDSLDLLGLSLPRREALYGSLSRSRHLLEGARDDIASLHKQLSRYRGNVWRLSFVGSLFAECWVLTGANFADFLAARFAINIDRMAVTRRSE